MPSGLMQLLSYGAQNIYLSGNPDISFFKSVYKRYSNFSNEYVNEYFLHIPTLDTINFTKPISHS